MWLLLFYISSKESISKLWKLVCISSKKLFSFSRYWIFCRFFHFLSTVSRFKGLDQKRNFYKHVLQLKKRVVSTSRLFWFFMILSINGDWVQRKKIKLTFSWSILRYLIFKTLSHILAVLGYLPSLRRVIGLAFSADFQYNFSKKKIIIK